MLTIIDNFLNKITMYKLVLYCLTFLWVVGLVFSFFGIMSFGPIDLAISFAILLASSLLINKIFAKLFHAPSNTESTYITASILALIAGPEKTINGFLFLILISFLAIASKYILAINKKHIFNPAAFSLVIGAYVFNYYASWWVGGLFMIPALVVAGGLMVRKLQRADLVLSFLAVFIIFSLWGNISMQNILPALLNLFAYSPILFFSFFMLTEPTTTPPKRSLRMVYGAGVAFLLAPFVHIGSIYFSAESALIAGNIFSYIISPKEKLILQLKEKMKIANSVYQFVFKPDRHLAFLPGQYLEWTLAHQKQDNRGMRRYFTIASSPTESDIKIGVKFYDKPSSYKKTLEDLHQGDTIIATQLAGEFTLPKDKNKKLVFLAGGIGVTPFRSMVKYLIDSNEKRNIVIFYASDNFADIAYREIFKVAEEKLGIKTIYALSDASNIPSDFIFEKGHVSSEMIIKYAPDYKDRTYYISGPRAMITSFEKTLQEIGIPKHNIKTDFFPGFA